jgi:hypothetical protein
LKEGGAREGRKAEMGREKGYQILKLVKPKVDRKTSNDWNDMRALMTEAHKLAVDMNLSSNEFTFDTVDIQTRFNPNIMINKHQSMMSIPGRDTVQRTPCCRRIRMMKQESRISER